MSSVMGRGAAVLVGVAASLLAAEARASTLFVFADDVQRKSFHTDITWKRNEVTKTGGTIVSTTQGGGGVVGGAGGKSPVAFTFVDPAVGGVVNHSLDAVFLLTGFAPSPSPAYMSGGHWVQPGIQGSFTFVYQGGNNVTYGSGAKAVTLMNGQNLLSATFTGAKIVGSGAKAYLEDSTADGGTITYASQFLTFYTGLPDSFTFTLTSVTPVIGTEKPGRALRTFSSNSSGSFSTSAVPEPASWALSLTGLGLIGAAMRRRRQQRARPCRMAAIGA